VKFIDREAEIGRLTLLTSHVLLPTAPSLQPSGFILSKSPSTCHVLRSVRPRPRGTACTRPRWDRGKLGVEWRTGGQWGVS
jgi:hypothetical protein